MADQKPYALDRIVRVLISAGILAGVIWMILGLTGRVFVVVQIIQDTILVPKNNGQGHRFEPGHEDAVDVHMGESCSAFWG